MFKNKKSVKTIMVVGALVLTMSVGGVLSPTYAYSDKIDQTPNVNIEMLNNSQNKKPAKPNNKIEFETVESLRFRNGKTFGKLKSTSGINENVKFSTVDDMEKHMERNVVMLSRKIHKGLIVGYDNDDGTFLSKMSRNYESGRGDIITLNINSEAISYRIIARDYLSVDVTNAIEKDLDTKDYDLTIVTYDDDGFGNVFRLEIYPKGN